MWRKQIRTLMVLALLGFIIGWTFGWISRGPVSSSGGLYFSKKVLIDVPQFFQADPHWAGQPLGPTTHTLGAEGCAISSAAMVLAHYGENVDPGKLNTFLTALPGGYTPEGWVYWEKAAQYDPALTAGLLPHYESAPSYFLIDWNLLQGNPVIVRLHYSANLTHFVVICGKEGYDYLIRDPGSGGAKGVYPLKALTAGIDALRYYRKPLAPALNGTK